MHRLIVAVCTILYLVGAASDTRADLLRFEQLCDISAAVAMGEGHILAASDEVNALYSFQATGGAPVAVRDVTSLLNMAFVGGEIDIEAAARSRDRIWWLGSHEPFKPSRQMIFATNIPAADLADLQVLVPPMNLTGLLRDSAEAANLWHSSTFLEEPDYGGLNIEAAAIGPDGQLWVGLRGPLDGSDGLYGNAIVVTLDMTLPATVVGVHRLDLLDRGIRAMAAIDGGFVIVAGGVADQGTNTPYLWTPGQAPRPVRQRPAPPLNVESIVARPGGWLMLSDDSSSIRPDTDGRHQSCKALADATMPTTDPGVFAQGFLAEWPPEERP